MHPQARGDIYHPPGSAFHPDLHARSCKADATTALTITECHQIEFMFICEINNQATVSVGHHPDEGQESIQWLELEKLMDYRLYPLSMREHFMQIDAATTTPVYLGDIN